MRILSKGLDIEKEIKTNCKSCGCEFVYTKDDVHHDQRDGYYVICPWCKRFIAHHRVGYRCW